MLSKSGTARLAALGAVVATMTTAASADAALLSTRLTVPLLGTTVNATLSSPLLESVLSGDTQLLDPAQDLLCPPLSSLDPTLGGAACAVGSLDYQYVTRLKLSGGGEVVRKHAAVVNVPTALNVDGDLLPDVIATLVLTSLNRFELRVDRALGEASPLPLLVEAIVDDPTNGALPRDFINVGYDARQSITPVSWRAVATLPEDGSADLTTIEVDQEVLGAGTTITTLGGLFDGDALARSNPLGGRLKYTPVPPHADLGLTLGRYLEVRAGASVPTNVEVDAEIVEGASDRRIHAGVTALPQSVRVRYEEPGTDQRTVTYAANAPVPAVDATYAHRQTGVLKAKAVARATGLPTGMVVRQLSARSGDFVATGGTLGSVEVGYANGEPQLLEVDHPYARIFDDGTLKSYAGRIDALQSASVDATSKIVGELQLGPDERKPFHAVVEQPGGRRIDGRVSNLPRHLKVLYDADGGLVQYDAFGETIDEITLDAQQDAPFFGRVTRIHGRIEQLPSQATVTIRPDGGGLRLETNNPIGKAEALLTSGPDASLPAGENGAQVEDVASRFTAFARVQGLRLVDVTAGPGDAVKGHVQLASTPLRLRYLRDGQTIDGRLSAIPSDVTVTFDPDAGKVDYAANAGISSIEATVVSDAALFGRVKRLDARVEQLPQSVSIGFKPATGSGASFAATPAVGMVQAALTDGTATATPLAAGKSGVIMKDLPSEFSLFGRLFNVSGGSFVSGGGTFNATLNTGPLAGGDLQDVDLDVTFDTPGDAVADPAHIVGFVQDLPSTLTLTQHSGGKTIYDASSTVPKVTLDARNLPGGPSGGSLDGGLHNAVGTLTGVPTHFEISAAPDAGVVANGPFTRLDLEAWDHGPQNAALPEDGRNKASLDLRDGRLHVQSRAFALSKLLLATSLTTKVESAFGATPAPMDIGVDGGTGAEPLDLDATLTDLPTSSTFTLGTVSGMKLGWTANSTATDVDIHLSSKDVGADLTLTDLPSFVDVCIGGGVLACGPKAPSFFQAGSDLWVFPNSFTAVTDANGTIRLDGKVCLPPTDDDGEALNPPGTVYGTCLSGTSPNRIEISNLRLKKQRLEFGSGDTTSEDEDGDPLEDDLLKLWLEGDSNGIRVDNLLVRNDTADSSTIIKAGHTGGLPLRNSGDHFFLLADMSGIPNAEIRENQIECDDLEVKVDLPLLGLTDVLPFPGEAVLGDVCIDH